MTETRPCPHAIADYQYATWHRCRDCGAMLRRDGVVGERTAPRDVAVPFPLLTFPAKAHARGGSGDAE